MARIYPFTFFTILLHKFEPTKKKTHINKKKMIDLLPLDYCPTENDIICGRGKAFAKISGNKRFVEIMRFNLPHYKSAKKRFDKTLVVAAVVKEVRATGARFIKTDSESKQFYELNAMEIHEKTGHAMRDLLKASKMKLMSTSQQKQQPKVSKPTRKRCSSCSGLPSENIIQSSFDNEFKGDADCADDELGIDSLDNLLFPPPYDSINSHGSVVDPDYLTSAPSLFNVFENSTSFFTGGGVCHLPDDIVSQEPVMTLFPRPLQRRRYSSWPLLSSSRQVPYYTDGILCKDAKEFLESGLDILSSARF